MGGDMWQNDTWHEATQSRWEQQSQSYLQVDLILRQGKWLCVVVQELQTYSKSVLSDMLSCSQWPRLDIGLTA